MDDRSPLHPEKIKAELRMRFGSLTNFEKQRRLAERSVSHVLFGRPSEKTAKAIADELDIPLHQVSPLYQQETTDVVHSRTAEPPHRLNREAR